MKILYLLQKVSRKSYPYLYKQSLIQDHLSFLKQYKDMIYHLLIKYCTLDNIFELDKILSPILEITPSES